MTLTKMLWKFFIC